MNKTVFFVIGIGLIFSMLFPSLLVAKNNTDLVGKHFLTRTNLKADKATIYFHNLKLSLIDIPVASEIIVTKVIPGKGFKIKLADTGDQYNMFLIPEQYDKYFVEVKEEIGLDNVSQEVMNKIGNMEVALGMTKEEVYISRGCPAYIGFGLKSWDVPLNKIMESDKWYYNLTSRATEMIVKFKGGVVAEIE